MRSRGKGHGPLFGKSSISLSTLPKTLNRTSAALSSSANIRDFMAASSCQSKLVIARLGLSMGGNARKPEASIQSNPTHRPGSIAQGRQTNSLQPFFDPPVVLPIFIAKQHAFEPLEMLVPTRCCSRSPDQLGRGYSPLLAFGCVIDCAESFKPAVGSIETFDRYYRGRR